MNPQNLFRQELFENKPSHSFGTVLINTPIHYQFSVMSFLVLILFIIFFFVFGEFSKKFEIPGYLNTVQGVAGVYPLRSGIISKSFHQQGDQVTTGEPLFLIKTSAKNSADAQLFHLKQKQKLIEKTVLTKETYVRSLAKLLKNKYVTTETFLNHKQELLSLKQQLNEIHIALINRKQEQRYIIYSPITGSLSSVLYKEGQFVDSNKPLAKVLPKNERLIVELYIPSQAIGFINQQDALHLRLDAFPFQQFGSVKARIKNISTTILTDEEENKAIQIGQPYYKATAELEKSFITIYGKRKTLYQGMTAKVMVAGPKRKIWQWVFAPLYNVYGSIFHE